ncbi:hypothetical protein SK803_23535 [Lentzea sp. BCCO 10_0856]|uniref:Uncharacterized protein n=1 Tax=Lentzea miocenica TaxID=3095431 RepID=A0ABU4T4W8_9PSEU|nr:hypothetical protein [Lentzea sp. BCCO 10_0856]MDX8033201.1 hypothetical protein [Lentzea sp. BCCO 10_0856]
MALGQVDDVRIELEDVRWSRWRARRATVVCRDVHVNPPAVLVSSPVEFRVEVNFSDIPELQPVSWFPLTVQLVGTELHVRLHKWLPARVFAVPELPRGIQLTGVEQLDDHFVLTGAAPVLRERLTLGQLAEVLKRLASIQSKTLRDTTSGISIWGT